MAEKKVKKKAGTPRKRRKLAGHSTGLLANELANGAPQSAVSELQEAIDKDGGKVLATYREPFSGHWVVLASLPIDQVEPTPYQRNLSDTHVRKLEGVIAKLGRFLDPIIVVRKESKDSNTRYWTPNGNAPIVGDENARRQMHHRPGRSGSSRRPIRFSRSTPKKPTTCASAPSKSSKCTRSWRPSMMLRRKPTRWSLKRPR